MSEDGRVLRFDSLSKVLSSGLRIGWCTGPAPLIGRELFFICKLPNYMLVGLAKCLQQHCYKHGVGKVLKTHIFSTKILQKQKGYLFKISGKTFDRICNLGTPKGGMFVWMKLLNVKDSKELIETKARDKKVLLVPGQAFHPLTNLVHMIRASFSSESEENMDM